MANYRGMTLICEETGEEPSVFEMWQEFYRRQRELQMPQGVRCIRCGKEKEEGDETGWLEVHVQITETGWNIVLSRLGCRLEEKYKPFGHRQIGPICPSCVRRFLKENGMSDEQAEKYVAQYRGVVRRIEGVDVVVDSDKENGT